jgi:hypothetical protein
MKTWQWPNAPKTDPPCETIIMLAERETDRLVLAELCDIISCNRAPTMEIQQQGISPRVMVESFASALAIEKPGDPVPDDVSQILDAASQALSCEREELLGRAFCVRFFAW